MNASAVGLGQVVATLVVLLLGGCGDNNRTEDLDPNAPLTEPTDECPLDEEAADSQAFAAALERMYACLNRDSGPKASAKCGEPEWFWYSSPQPVEGSEKGVVGWQTTTCSLIDFSGEIANFEYRFNTVYTPTAKVVSRRIPVAVCQSGNDQRPASREEATAIVQNWLECEGWTADYIVTCWGPKEERWRTTRIDGRLTSAGLMIHCQAFNDAETIIAFPQFISEYLYDD